MSRFGAVDFHYSPSRSVTLLLWFAKSIFEVNSGIIFSPGTSLFLSGEENEKKINPEHAAYCTDTNLPRCHINVGQGQGRSKLIYFPETCLTSFLSIGSFRNVSFRRDTSRSFTVCIPRCTVQQKPTALQFLHLYTFLIFYMRRRFISQHQ